MPVLRTWKSHSHFFRQSMLNGMVLYDDFRLGSNRYSGVGRERAGGDVWTGASVNVVLGKYQGRTGRRAFSKSLNHSTLPRFARHGMSQLQAPNQRATTNHIAPSPVQSTTAISCSPKSRCIVNPRFEAFSVGQSAYHTTRDVHISVCALDWTLIVQRNLRRTFWVISAGIDMRHLLLTRPHTTMIATCVGPIGDTSTSAAIDIGRTQRTTEIDGRI